jgi:hypothetical protein
MPAMLLRRLKLGELQFKASLGKIVCKTPSQWIKKLSMKACACHPSDRKKFKIGL